MIKSRFHRLFALISNMASFFSGRFFCSRITSFLTAEALVQVLHQNKRLSIGLRKFREVRHVSYGKFRLWNSAVRALGRNFLHWET